MASSNNAVSSSAIPDPLWIGTVIYWALTIICMMAGCALRGAGKLDKENSSICILLTFITGLCLWLMWAGAWLHQWHPLLEPQMASE